jgi:hypothetical protein
LETVFLYIGEVMAMPDEPEHKSLLETVGDEIFRCLPEWVRNNEGLSELCGLAAGWFVGKKIAELLFRKRDDK